MDLHVKKDGSKGSLTKGPIARSLMLFALPLLGSSLVEQLYNTVDLLFVGNFLGTQAAAAIGASTLLVTCLIGFFGGLSLGSAVVVSQAFGAHDNSLLNRAMHNTIALSLVGSMVLMGFGYLFAPTYLQLTKTPFSIMADANLYLRIYFISFISIVIYNFGAAFLRALGDAKRPLIAQLAGGIANVFMDWFCLAVFGLGIIGVALSTLVSQTIAAIYVLVRLTRVNPTYSLHFRCIKFDMSILRRVVGIGLPAGLQALVITLSNVVVQSCINGLGTAAIAAFTSYFKVELIIYLPIVAFGQAITTFSAQNWGAGNTERVRYGTHYCAMISMAIAAATSLIAIATGPWLFGIFVPDPNVIDLGCRIIQITFPFYFLYSIMQVYGDSIRGLGKTKIPMVIVLVNICVVRTVLLLAVMMPLSASVQSVALAYPITWATAALCMFLYYRKTFHVLAGQRTKSTEKPMISLNTESVNS